MKLQIAEKIRESVNGEIVEYTLTEIREALDTRRTTGRELLTVPVFPLVRQVFGFRGSHRKIYEQFMEYYALAMQA
jgi:hypothetical protein